MCDATDTPAMESQPQLQKERVVGTPSKLCVKCKAAKPSVSIRRSLYCRDCFVRASVTKFRTALSKSRKRMPVARARVMVALSGGATSSAMLQLMADYQRMELKGYAAEPTYASVVAGHVDESALFSGYDDAQICDIAAAIDIECRVARLEDVFALEGDRAALLELVHATIAPGTTRDQFCVQLTRGDESKPAREQLRALFAGLGSATDREDMLDIIKAFLLARLARQAQCELLLLGDSGTRIASKLVSLTSRGRGFSLPLEVGAETPFLGSSSSGVMAYRPMRDLIMKEIAFFNLWTRQPSVVVPTFTTGAPETASIDRLTESFVVGLDRDFVSTVPTVCRTVQKLELCPEALTAAQCIVCSMPAEANAQAWRNRLTVNVAPSEQSLEHDIAPSADIQSPLSSFGVTAHLCYSCQSLLHFAKPGVALPAFCLENYREQATTSPPSDAENDVDADSQQRRESLRLRIEEFFI
ncbi:Cytoplasmic tRNA 2-thiolation protein 2 [Coemansia aciculifera]|uniref:Cytoplasmic tRNA 2-thiolation protein 2 n=1 Tax=Coemansia aciculifera TaxID=417176 RepID=A0A9W8IN43_9FUNG|nr:Cytoplasmic tRNA 2-thiolation protein 2 [Coemansia aciculifera]